MHTEHMQHNTVKKKNQQKYKLGTLARPERIYYANKSRNERIIYKPLKNQFNYVATVLLN